VLAKSLIRHEGIAGAFRSKGGHWTMAWNEPNGIAAWQQFVSN
jgi:hypothetical protein